MKRIIIMSIIIYPFLSANAQETINIKGIDIPLNEIPLTQSYQIKKSNLKSAKIDTTKAIPHTAFASNHKNYIAIASSQNVVRENTTKAIETVKETTLEMYDKKGKLKWKTQKDNYNPIIGRISEKTGRSIFIWSSSQEYSDNKQLALYDPNGKEEFTDDHLRNIPFADNNNEIIFYTKDPYLSNKIDDVNTLFCYNTITKSKWSKKFDSPKPFAIVGIAGNGSYVLCGLVSLNNNDGSVLYCVNNKGEVLWKKEFQENLGYNWVSLNGEYFVRIPNNSSFELYNSKGEILFIKSKEFIMGYNLTPDGGCFVKNDEKIIAINSNVASHKSIIAFYDLNGVLLDNLIIPYEGSLYIELYTDNKYHVFVDSKLVLEYTRKWNN